MNQYENKNIKELKEVLLSKNEYVSKIQLEILKKEISVCIKWFNIALTNMVHSNINAFITLCDGNNFHAARAVIRMQLNCLMRLFSIFIIVPQEKWINILLFEENSRNTHIIYNGKKRNLTDSFFAEQLHNCKILQNSKQMYKDFSEFIHPSNMHFAEAITKWNEKMVKLNGGA